MNGGKVYFRGFIKEEPIFTLYSRKYKTAIKFWRYGESCHDYFEEKTFWEIRVRTVDYVKELGDLEDYDINQNEGPIIHKDHEGCVICEGGRLSGNMCKFYEGWDDNQFQAACRSWWRQFLKRVN